MPNNICLFEKEKWQPKFVDLIEKGGKQNLLFDPGNFVSSTQNKFY